MLVHIGHPNPAADRDARLALKGINRIHVIPPVDYPDLVAMLDRASVIVTDSGGLQEEAPSFGIPVLVTREITERPEVLKCGGILIGTDPSRLRAGMQSALRRTGRVRSHRAKTPFGDGRASQRIVKRLSGDLRGT